MVVILLLKKNIIYKIISPFFCSKEINDYFCGELANKSL